MKTVILGFLKKILVRLFPFTGKIGYFNNGLLAVLYSQILPIYMFTEIQINGYATLLIILYLLTYYYRNKIHETNLILYNKIKNFFTNIDSMKKLLKYAHILAVNLIEKLLNFIFWVSYFMLNFITVKFFFLWIVSINPAFLERRMGLKLNDTGNFWGELFQSPIFLNPGNFLTLVVCVLCLYIINFSGAEFKPIRKRLFGYVSLCLHLALVPLTGLIQLFGA